MSALRKFQRLKAINVSCGSNGKRMCNDSVNFNLRLESAHFGQEGDILLPLTLPVVMYESRIYRSVPLIRPPILYTTSSLKWRGGLYSNMQLVSSISPPPPKFT